MRIPSMLLAAVSALAFATTALASEKRLEINRSLNLDELARTGRIVIATDRVGAAYQSDASAVLKGVSFTTLMRASADFDRYAQMGMPNVQESHIVGRNGNTVYTWTAMNISGILSRHYLQVELHQQLNPEGAAGSEWQLVHRQPSWGYPERSALKVLDGSWYAQRLPNGNVYVRYFLSGEIDTWVPPALMDWIVKTQFEDGVKKVIQVLARQAAVR